MGRIIREKTTIHFLTSRKPVQAKQKQMVTQGLTEQVIAEYYL